MNLSCPTCQRTLISQFAYKIGSHMYCPNCVEVEMNDGHAFVLNHEKALLVESHSKRKMMNKGEAVYRLEEKV